MLITGPPGMGKSAFLGHLATHAPHCYGNAQIIPVIVSLHPLRTEQDLSQQIANAIKEEKSPTRAILENLGNTLWDNLAKTLGNTLSDTLGEVTGVQVPLHSMLDTIGKQIMQHTKIVPLLCMLIDEIQTATEANNGPILRNLHTKEFLTSHSARVCRLVERIQRTGRRRHLAPLRRSPHRSRTSPARTCTASHPPVVRAIPCTRKSQKQGRTRPLRRDELSGISATPARRPQRCITHAGRIGRRTVRRTTPIRRSNGPSRANGQTTKISLLRVENDRQSRKIQTRRDRPDPQKPKKTKHPFEQEDIIAWAHQAMRQRSPLERKPTQDDAIALVQQMYRRGILEFTPEGRSRGAHPLDAYMAHGRIRKALPLQRTEKHQRLGDLPAIPAKPENGRRIAVIGRPDHPNTREIESRNRALGR